MKTFRKVSDVVSWVNSQEMTKPLAVRLEQNKTLLDILELLEHTNPCRQLYFVTADAVVITYELKLNLLSFQVGSLKIRSRILGLPISLCREGILAVDPSEGLRSAGQVLAASPGLSIALNLPHPLGEPRRTLSSFILNCRWTSFEEYLRDLRAPYRRNAHHVLSAGQELSYRRISPMEFQEDHFALYQAVLSRSQYPLESLSIDFFRGCAGELVEVRDDQGKLRAMLVLEGAGETLRFMFCGFLPDDRLCLYNHLLLYIVRRGIEDGYQWIDFGQTSEEAKLRLGCDEEYRYFAVHHANPVLNALINRLSSHFCYASPAGDYRVFRENTLEADRRKD